MDKLGAFHANQTSMCLNPLLYKWQGRYLKTRAIFLLTVLRRWIFFVICYLCLSLLILDVCLLQPCGQLLGKG